MKTNIIKKIFNIKTLTLCILMLIGTNLQSQENQINKNAQNYVDTTLTRKDTIPSWWFGAAVGGNLNYYRGSTQNVNANLFSYPAFHNGNGIGLYIAPVVIFHNPEKVFGGMFELGYDNRKGKFNEVTTPCNCPADLKTNLSYITIEPSIHMTPFKGNFYLFAGPRMGITIGKSFVYNKGKSVDGLIPAEPQLKGNFTNMYEAVISMHIGAGYDIILTSNFNDSIKGSKEGRKYNEMVLSPFIDFHPYFGQNPRTIETWNLTTIRIGAVLKFGHVKIQAKTRPIIIPVSDTIIPVPVPVVVIPVIIVVPEPIKITTAYTLYFKFDESNLDNQTINYLDNLINDLKKDTTIGIQIKSYADMRGTEDYNISLSERRGKAVVDYMISKGIDISRINSTAYGKTKIFNEYKESTNEIEYALNRRSNIIVIGIASKK